MPNTDKDTNQELNCSPDSLGYFFHPLSAVLFCFVLLLFVHSLLHASVLYCFSIYMVETVHGKLLQPENVRVQERDGDAERESRERPNFSPLEK